MPDYPYNPALPYRERVEIYPMRRGSILTGLLPGRNMPATFGGGVDPGETDYGEVAARELQEETGWKSKNIRPAGLDPIVYDWDQDNKLSDKQKERRKDFRGERTHFYMGDVYEKEDPIDPSNYEKIKFRRPGTLLKLIELANQPNIYQDSHKTLLNRLVNKQAAVYQLEGNVQGVGLRKTLHSLLDELKHPGVAVNNARTDQVNAVIPGNKKKQEKILALLRERLQDPNRHKVIQEGVDYNIKPLPIREKLHQIAFTDRDIKNFTDKQRFDVMAREPLEAQRQWFMERYRLTPDAAGALTGKVPHLAKQQLFEGEPVYSGQLKPDWIKRISAIPTPPQNKQSLVR